MVQTAEVSIKQGIEFEFFCSERHTFESLQETVVNVYKKICEEERCEVPSSMHFRIFLFPLFKIALFERYILRNEQDDPHDIAAAGDLVRKLWESGKFENIDKLIDHCFEHIQGISMVGINGRGVKFMNDVNGILRDSNLRFLDQTDIFNYYEFYNLSNGINSYDFDAYEDINNPICEVW